MDCRNWDEEAYRDSILQEREALCRTVFRTAFAPSPDPNPDLIVAASSDGSVGCYSISCCLSSPHLGSGNAWAQNLAVVEPEFLLKGHDGPAYDVKFYGNSDNSLLLSCGDDGRIRGWRWKEILDSEVSTLGGHLKPAIDLVNPQHKGPWGALSPIPENNAIAVDFKAGSIYAAAGDSCAYCWDVEKAEIKTIFKGHSDYLHCIVACNSRNQIITGSEDGTARVWDCKSGKSIQIIKPENNMKLNARVNCIALDSSDSWLACGTGWSLSVWNLPACERVSSIPVCTSIQDVSFDNNQILAVGADTLLTRFSMDERILSQIQCAPQSAFSISLHSSGVTAVAGFGALVDVVSQFGSHLCTLRCRGL